MAIGCMTPWSTTPSEPAEPSFSPLYAVALHITWINYCRPHTTLTKVARGVKTTPAMAAGLADRVWTAEDVLALLAPVQIVA